MWQGAWPKPRKCWQKTLYSSKHRQGLIWIGHLWELPLWTTWRPCATNGINCSWRLSGWAKTCNRLRIRDQEIKRSTCNLWQDLVQDLVEKKLRQMYFLEKWRPATRRPMQAQTMAIATGMILGRNSVGVWALPIPIVTLNNLNDT